MKIEFLNRFYKDLDKISSQKINKQIASVIVEVENAETITKIRNVKKLKNSKIAYRIRIGDYRIGLYFEHNTVEFARIAHRKDIYKVFP